MKKPRQWKAWMLVDIATNKPTRDGYGDFFVSPRRAWAEEVMVTEHEEPRRVIITEAPRGK